MPMEDPLFCATVREPPLRMYPQVCKLPRNEACSGSEIETDPRDQVKPVNIANSAIVAVMIACSGPVGAESWSVRRYEIPQGAHPRTKWRWSFHEGKRG